MFKKKDIQNNTRESKKLYNLISKTEKKSALDYKYWEIKVLHQITNGGTIGDFERDFVNLAILSKKNVKKQKTLKVFYLRNIPRFSKEMGKIIISK